MLSLTGLSTLPDNSGKLEKGLYSSLFSHKDGEFEGEDEVKFCGEVNLTSSQIKLSNLEIESSYFSGDEDSSLYLENCIIRCQESFLVHSLKLTMVSCLVEIILSSEDSLTCLDFNSSQIEIRDSSFSITLAAKEVILLKSLNAKVSLITSSILFVNEEFLSLLFSQAIESNVSLSSLSLFLPNPLSLLFNQMINSTLCAKKINISSPGFIPFQLGERGKIKDITVNGEDVLKEKITGSRLDYFNHISYPLQEDVEVDTSCAPVIFDLPSSSSVKEITITNPACGLVIIGKCKRRRKRIKLLSEEGKWRVC